MTPPKKPSGQTWARVAYDFREKAEKLEAENAALKEALRWYVERDETFEGGQWESRNAKSLAGKRRAMRLLGMPVEAGECDGCRVVATIELDEPILTESGKTLAELLANEAEEP